MNKPTTKMSFRAKHVILEGATATDRIHVVFSGFYRSAVLRSSRMTYFILSSVFCVFLSLPNFVLAQDASLRFENPLGALGGPGVLYGRVIKNFLVPALGTAALLMFVYGGFLMISSAGNEEKAKKGQQAMYWAVVGVGAALFSYIILTFFISALTGSTSVPT